MARARLPPYAPAHRRFACREHHHGRDLDLKDEGEATLVNAQVKGGLFPW
jgi:hypothetical protein